ncbi:MAG: DUF3604 domain-containing protein [Alphaproteobacteria bacterium]
MIRKLLTTTALLSALTVANTATAADTNLYWGDTHLHTKNSFDAFLNGNITADPDTAYNWAKGKPVIHPYHRKWIKIDTPLDFLVVSDHAEFMGVMPAIYNGDEFPDVGFVSSILRWYFFRTIRNAVAENRGGEVFADILASVTNTDGPTDIRELAQAAPANIPVVGDTTAIEQRTWDEIADAADRHNDPGKFTAFIGWEWSTVPSGANLHRIVMSPTDGETAKQFLPYGSDQSQLPEDLWDWLKETEERTGAPFIAMPHNSNISKGYMFHPELTMKGEAITADYARIRAEMEPVVEVTQIKGDSETWPSLSPDDAFADFNGYPNYIQVKSEEYMAREGDFIRPALKNGLKIEDQVGVNPFKFGVIGSTDAHSGIASADDNNFHGKMALDSVPENKQGNRASRSVNGWSMSAAGYAAVWAEDNTRDAIFAAFKRREVYASTGPRIALRVFGGTDFSTDDASAADLADIGYDKGVPMGGDLIAADKPTQLLIRAVKDPKGANLDRVQVVKGWLDANGATQEKIYDVALGGDNRRTADGTVTPVGNTVDLSTGRTANTIGAAELATVWTDPDYDAAQRAFYYVRVLEIPSARHSLFDTIALNIPHNEEDAGPATQQQRAYSSPIWVTPKD